MIDAEVFYYQEQITDSIYYSHSSILLNLITKLYTQTVFKHSKVEIAHKKCLIRGEDSHMLLPGLIS